MILKTEVCPECGGPKFRQETDSILFRRYSFIKAGSLYICSLCGAKTVACDKCGHIIYHAHLALDPYTVPIACPNCAHECPLRKEWVKKMLA